MKYKLIEKVPIPIPRHKNKKDIGEKIIVKAQTEKEYLILDLFRYNRYISRYVLNAETGEHREQRDFHRFPETGGGTGHPVLHNRI